VEAAHPIPEPTLRATRRSYTFRYRSPEHFVEFFREHYGPTLKAFAALDDGGREALAEDIAALVRRFDRLGTDSAVAFPADYLEAGIASETAARLLVRLEAGRADLPRGALLVVDEAGMMPTRALEAQGLGGLALPGGPDDSNARGLEGLAQGAQEIGLPRPRRRLQHPHRGLTLSEGEERLALICAQARPGGERLGQRCV
jgi:hypothetical protein